MEHNLAILWKIWMWIWLSGECYEYLSSSSGSPRKWIWHEFKICKETSLENSGAAFQGNKQAGQWLISKIRGVYRQAFCTVELLNIALPKPTSSPTLYSVRDRWEAILSNLGRSKFNGIRTTILSKNWIELMDNLWNSSGRFPQDSLQCESSIRFNRWWENYSVNQRTSQAG